MKPSLSLAFVLVSSLAAGCGTTGDHSNGSGSQYGAITGDWKCTCPSGVATCKLKCPDGTAGECQGGQPFCDVSSADGGYACACPNGAASCSITCPDGTKAECTDGEPDCQPGSPGLCCPAGRDFYACAFPDGGSGFACHNSNMGCASSMTCGQGCDEVVTGRCGGSSVGTEDGGSGGPETCCPAGWDLYSCTFTDGGSGQACHNPELGCASSSTCGEGCDQVVTGRCESDGGTSGDGGSAGLQWYTTCGYPVCGPGGDGGSGDDGCPAAGTPCAQEGATCGTATAADCGVTLVCASEDPKGGPGGCPISSRRYKDDIHYVGAAQLERLHEDVLGLKLATYKYLPNVADPKPTHLGFIIEDSPRSPAVDGAHHRVDLYGYVSMVVAGMQVQEKEIAQLRQELKATRTDLNSCRAGK